MQILRFAQNDRLSREQSEESRSENSHGAARFLFDYATPKITSFPRKRESIALRNKIGPPLSP